ncbi:MAG: DUF4931 domain-containing protein [Planctomycetota bacterium]
MSELRWDALRRQWVILASERASRPNEFFGTPERHPKVCPFCEGHESETLPEICAVRAPGSMPDRPGWQVRCFGNKFPAVEFGPAWPAGAPDLGCRRQGTGAHEVVVESPWHDRFLEDLDEGHVALVLGMFRERLRRLQEDPRFEYVFVFKNHGAAAGASLRHPHSQIIALPFLPLVVRTELRGAREHLRATGRCLFCDLVARDADGGARLVSDDWGFSTVTPFASRFSYELVLAPTVHAAAFDEIADGELTLLARALMGALRRLRGALGDSPYNLLLHTSPVRGRRGRTGEECWLREGFHWHIEILPRVGYLAGFEWGTGESINSVPPEEAAARLRRVAL